LVVAGIRYDYEVIGTFPADLLPVEKTPTEVTEIEVKKQKLRLVLSAKPHVNVSFNEKGLFLGVADDTEVWIIRNLSPTGSG
jgi:hypothetical protein